MLWLAHLMFGSFMVGCGFTLLTMGIWINYNKYYKIVKTG